MRKFAVLAVLVTALVTALTISPAASAARPGTTEAVTNQLTATGPLGSFVGSITDIQFVNQQGQLAVQGLLNGVFTPVGGGAPVNIVDQLVTLPVLGGGTGATCQILDLTLGPLDLDLLGLVVHLDTVHLNITAEQGPGNLLGNLLCGLAGALDPGAGGLAGLLNRLLGL